MTNENLRRARASLERIAEEARNAGKYLASAQSEQDKERGYIPAELFTKCDTFGSALKTAVRYLQRQEGSRHNLNYDSVAERIGVTQGIVARWAADYVTPSLYHLIKLIEELKIDPRVIKSEMFSKSKNKKHKK